MIRSSEVISFETLMNDSSKGWPTFEDLKMKRVHINRTHIQRVEELLHDYHPCLIRGAEGRGKTALARIVASNCNKWKIRIIDVREIREEDINNVFTQIEHAANHRRTLLIVENAHYSLDAITPKLIEYANTHSSINFIFTMRVVFFQKHDQVSNPFEEWIEKEWCVDLNPSLEEACSVIETFISAERLKYLFTDNDKYWVKKEFGMESINLRRLNWYLKTWKEEGGVLSSVKKENVLKNVLRYYRNDLNNQNAKLNISLENMLYRVAGVFQFDIDFYGGGFDSFVLTELKKKGVTSCVKGNFQGDYYRLQHSSDGFYIIEALANEKQTDHVTITTEILKEYLIKEPTNYFQLIKAIYQSDNRLILLSIFNDEDTLNKIIHMIKKDRLEVACNILEYFVSLFSREKGLKYWFQYKKVSSESVNEQNNRFRSKITDMNLTQINYILSFLNKINIEEKEWFINDVLNADILVQKVSNASFNQITKLFELIPDDLMSDIILKLDSEDIANKAKHSTAQRIMWFLKYSSRNFYLFNWEELLESDRIGFQFHVEYFDLSWIENAKVYKIDNSQVKLHYGNRYLFLIRQKESISVKFDNKEIYDFIIKRENGKVNVYRKSDNKKFLISFLKAINKDDYLITILNNSTFKTTNECLRLIRDIDQNFSEELKSKFTPYWLQALLSSNLRAIVRELGGICTDKGRWSYGDPKESGSYIVKQLASIELSEKIKELYTMPSTRPLKVLGKLLHFCNQVNVEADKNSIEKITFQVINNIDLNLKETYTLEELSLLVSNVKKNSEPAWRQLCNMVLHLKLTNYIATTFENGLSALVWNIYQYDLEKSNELIDKILSLNVDKCLEQTKPKEFGNLIWNLSQINNLKAKKWIQNIREETLLSKAVSISAFNAFLLLYNIYCIDKETVKKIMPILANIIAVNRTKIEPEDIPILGFLLYSDVRFELKTPIPSSSKIAEKMSKELNLPKLAFCIYFLEKKTNESVNDLLTNIGKYLFLENKQFSIKEKLAKIPDDDRKQFFMDTLKDFEIEYDPKLTFCKMIHETDIYLTLKKKNQASYTELREFFISSDPPSNNIFNSSDNAKKWINRAIDYGIYVVKEDTYYSNPSTVLKVISLNNENDFVLSYLRET